MTPAEIDVFDETNLSDRCPAAGRTAPKRRSRLGRIFARRVRHAGLAGGRPVDGPADPRTLPRAEWLGWLAAGMAALAAMALVVILAREMLAIARLASVEKLRARALDAIARDDPKTARAVVAELSSFLSQASRKRPQAGARSPAFEDDIIDGANLVRIAETEILPRSTRARNC